MKAARKAFSEIGDVNGTTIKAIADHGGISEAVIYQHFDSKEHLFLEAVVEPLNLAVNNLVAAGEVVDRDEPLTPERQLETLNGLYRQLISTLEEVLPLLGLVLFGDPKIARHFYKDHFSVALHRLEESWREVEVRYGYKLEPLDITVRAVMGTSLLLALESHYDKNYELDRAISLATRGTVNGFFPSFPPVSSES